MRNLRYHKSLHLFHVASLFDTRLVYFQSFMGISHHAVHIGDSLQAGTVLLQNAIPLRKCTCVDVCAHAFYGAEQEF